MTTIERNSFQKRGLILIMGSVMFTGLIAGLAYYLLDHGYISLNHPSYKTFPIRGIDISHHQGPIHWQKLNRAEVHFVYMKATEGGDFLDPLFKKNWLAAERIGLHKGAYHFFTLCKSGREQAANFLAHVPVETDSLPPAIDLEFGGNCSKRPVREDVLLELGQFINLLEIAYQKQPILYVTSPFLEKYIQTDLPQYNLWIRAVYGRPRPPRDWIIWQYNARGHRHGINGFVDLNVFHGSRQDFKKFIQTGLPTN